MLFTDLEDADKPVIKIEVLQSYCEPDFFTINGMDASLSDFGGGFDTGRDSTHQGCENHKFIPNLPSGIILEKYSINVDAYAFICKTLKERLSFGACSLNTLLHPVFIKILCIFYYTKIKSID